MGLLWLTVKFPFIPLKDQRLNDLVPETSDRPAERNISHSRQAADLRACMERQLYANHGSRMAMTNGGFHKWGIQKIAGGFLLLDPENHYEGRLVGVSRKNWS